LTYEFEISCAGANSGSHGYPRGLTRTGGRATRFLPHFRVFFKGFSGMLDVTLD